MSAAGLRVNNQDASTSSPQEKPRSRYCCYLCSRTYERQDHLSRHLKAHENERNYRCPECGKGFNRADLLNRHRAAHSKGGTAENFRRRTGKACEGCIRAKTKCDEERPCKRCKTRKTTCIPTDSRSEHSSQSGVPASSPIPTTRDNDAAEAIISLSHSAGNDVSLGGDEYFQHAQEMPPADDMGLGDFGFSDFFENIMMPGSIDTAHYEPLVPPPDVSNFTQDFDMGLMDFDFSWLASGLTRPTTAYSMHENESSLADSTPTTQSDAQLRSEAFKKSPWSWNHWIPTSQNTTFSGQDEINVTEQRVNSDDQLTPGSERQYHCALEVEARDRMIRVVTQIADSRLAIPSFPSLELLEDLIDIFLLQDSSSIDSFIHAPSLTCQDCRTELLLAMVAAGATYIALDPVWKMGLVLQEVVRMALATVFEGDNSTTRQMQPLQAYILWLKVGIWSGFRRKTEIASSFLQPLTTMLSWSNSFSKFPYKDVFLNEEDSDEMLATKWSSWTDQEGFKRLVLHTAIWDSQVSMAHLKNPLISPAQMLLPLPAPRKLWLAQDAHSWRNHIMRTGYQESSLPSVMAIAGNIRMLDDLQHITDKPLCIMLACHTIAYEVFQFRQQALLHAYGQIQPRRDRWLAHVSRQKELYEDLTAIQTYCEMQTESTSEALFTLEYLMMSLHVSLDDIQLFTGRSGEEEARRIYPQIKAWTEDTVSRIAIWHAGQTIRVARGFERTKLRDFYAVALYHASLTLWVYGMVTSNTARKSGVQTPAQAQSLPQNLAFSAGLATQHVILDGEDNRTTKAFRHLGHGKPCLLRTLRSSNYTTTRLEPYGADTCSLQNSKGIMLLGADLLRNNYPKSHSGLPPLVENLANLMTELAGFSGRPAS